MLIKKMKRGWVKDGEDYDGFINDDLELQI